MSEGRAQDEHNLVTVLPKYTILCIVLTHLVLHSKNWSIKVSSRSVKEVVCMMLEQLPWFASPLSANRT